MAEKARTTGRLFHTSISAPNFGPMLRQWEERIVGFSEPQVFTDFRVVALNKVTEKDREGVVAAIGKYKSISIAELGEDGLNQVVKFGAKRRLEGEHKGINFVANVINEVRERATDVRLATNVVFPTDRQKFLTEMGSPMYTHVPGPKADLVDKVIRADAINRLGLTNGLHGVATSMVSRVRGSADNILRSVADINPLKIDFPVVVVNEGVPRQELSDADRMALERYQFKTGGVHSADESIDRRFFNQEGDRIEGMFIGEYLQAPHLDNLRQPEEERLLRHRELHVRFGPINWYVRVTPDMETTPNKLLGHDKRNQARESSKPQRIWNRILKAA